MSSLGLRRPLGHDFFDRASHAAQKRFIGIATVVMTLFSYWLATGRTWKSTHTDVNYFGADFFRNQADAILHGRLDVPFKSYSWTECVIVNGKCYGYFGIFPSLLRIPEFLLTGSRSVNHIPLYIALGVGLCFWASLDLLIRFVQGATEDKGLDDALTNRVLILGVLLIGPASALTFLSEPAMYEEAIVWAVAMTMLAVNMVHRWTRESKTVYLVIAVTAGVAAANSRFTAVPAMVVLGAYLLYRGIKLQPRDHDQMTQRLGIALIVLPVLTFGLVMYGKFGQFFAPNEALVYYNTPIMRAVREANNGSYTGPRFVLTQFAQFLRPDSLGLSSTYPWVRFLVPNTDNALVLPPLVRAGTMSDHSISITNTMFVQLGLALSATWISVRHALRSRSLLLSVVLLVATASMTGPTLMIYANTARYVSDFYPFLILGSIIGISMLVTTKSISGSLKTTALNIGIVIAVAQTFVWYNLQINRWS